MRTKLSISIVVLACIAIYSLWPDRQATRSSTHEPDVLLHRVWIDHLPESPNDKLHVLAILEEPRAGSFLHTSAFEGDYSMFEWKTQESGRMDIVMLQTGKRHRVRFKLSHDNCRGFDYCMKVTGAPRGAERYYSMKEWVIESGDAGAATRALYSTVQRLISAKQE